jgi:hypothetical protein
LAIQPIDGANRTLAVMAGHGAGRIAGGPPRLPGVYALVKVTPTAPVAPTDAIETVALGAPGAQPQLTPAATKAQVIAAATQQAVVRQDGLAPLIADLAQALKTGALPQPVRQAAARVLIQATPLEAHVDGPAIAKALGGSGLLLEADLAANPMQSPVGVDLKAGLLMLRQALANAGPAAPRRALGGARPAPPYRGGPTRGQAPAEPSLAEDSPPDVQRQRLAQETESALARLELMQIASLPQDEAEPISRWMFEAPVMTPQGTAVAQFEISRDPRGRNAAGQEAPIWRARFGLDIEPLGPINAHVSLSNGQIGVTLWAERQAGEAMLRAHAPSLVRALAGPQVHAEVSIYPGRPAAATAVAGQLLNQAV